MQTAACDLPKDPAQLRALLLAARADLAAKDAALEAANNALKHRDLQIEKLKIELARLKRMRFGKSSEKLDRQIEQLELLIEELETPARAQGPSAPSVEPRRQPVRKPLPEHLPRESVIHDSDCACPTCGGRLRSIGEDVSETLEYVPEHFKVIRHVRPKSACDACDAVVQASAPSRPIARSYAGPGLLSHVLVSKYADHLPLHRQSRMYARDGVEIDVSTLADWVGQSSTLLAPLVEALNAYVMAGSKLHADDTPVPVLAKGLGRTKTGRLWTYVRDDRASGSKAPPAVLFRYTPDRKGERPRAHLAEYAGALQADGYAGFHHLYGDKIYEVACWAHVRRKFFDIHKATESPIAQDILQRIGALYDIERDIRRRPPDERKAARQSRAGPLLEDLHKTLRAVLTQVSKKSELAKAVGYTLPRWTALTRYRDDGLLEIDNNAAERALRCVALGRKNYLFAGADTGGERAANIYSLIGTAELCGINPEAYLTDVLKRIADHPINRIDELLPWNLARTLVEESNRG